MVELPGQVNGYMPEPIHSQIYGRSWKPHPYGNEYHSICDGAINDNDNKKCGNLMWHVELQEGKDRPASAGPKKCLELGKTLT
jgi:hypothetical protein